MWLPLNPNSGIPLYRQLFQQLRERINSGQLAANTQLPSVRELSASLHINPLTVSKVYQLLEKDGLVKFRRGQGTFVLAPPHPASLSSRRKEILPSVEQVVAEALHLQLCPEELHNLIDATFAKAHNRNPPP